ncbi:MAG: hypothetical protein M1827_003316 [Pycnora praestabilis]|nr:MAG: hypothetical protein M1827_003316 [Pycnora praestabilis]
MSIHGMSEDMDNVFDFPVGFGDESTEDTQMFKSDFSSPHFTTINDPTASDDFSSPATISPKDLIRDPLASVPPSTAFTNLTSPSIFESPDITDSFETSPLFNNADTDLTGGQWYSLFPGANGENVESPPVPTEEIFDSSALASAMSLTNARRRSSPGESPLGGHNGRKHSSISGVNARKRDKPLPPIVVEDPNDTTAMKRARNTAAARKSRQKKVEKFEELEKYIEDLEGQVEHWKNIALSRNGEEA